MLKPLEQYYILFHFSILSMEHSWKGGEEMEYLYRILA